MKSNFDELQQIWCEQDEKPLFDLNDTAMYDRVLKRNRHADLASNVSEFGLIAISILTFAFLAYKNLPTAEYLDMVPGVILLGTSVYVWFSRQKRLWLASQYDHSVLGMLDQAMSNIDFEIRRSQTFVLWYIAPLIIGTMTKMYIEGAPPIKWALISGSMILSVIVVHIGLYFGLNPKKRSLNVLRERILDEAEPGTTSEVTSPGGRRN